MAGIGHNGGPAWEGISWRTHCWREARARLLPVLPIEVVRTRVRRAAALGLDYKTYAGVRSTTGRDIIAFLFSSNALQASAAGKLPEAIGQHLGQIQGADRLALAQMIAPQVLQAANPALLDHVAAAPMPMASFGQIAMNLRHALGKLPGDGVVLVCSQAPWEKEWVAAGKLAAALPADRLFRAA